MAEPDEFIPTRQTLLGRLKDWTDQESWKEFFETYWRLIYSAALKAGLTDAEAQEVVQETIISVSKSMPQFTYDPKLGSFKTWLMRLTSWRISDQLRKREPQNGLRHRHPDETAGTATVERIPDPNGFYPCWDEAWEQNIIDVAIERVKGQVDPKHYQMFDLYVLQKWPVKKIATTLKVNAGRVYLAKHRVSGLIQKEMKRLKKKME